MGIRDALPSIYLRPWPAATSGAVSGHKVSFRHTLQATINVFARHPLPVVVCAFACFAGAGIVGSLVYGVMIGEALIAIGFLLLVPYGQHKPAEENPAAPPPPSAPQGESD